jgi:hypothetical protein
VHVGRQFDEIGNRVVDCTPKVRHGKLGTVL